LAVWGAMRSSLWNCVFPLWALVGFLRIEPGFGAAEVRAKNSFMHRVLVVHAVTMLFLLGGMFGLSMTAAELSKETRVSHGGSLVTPGGEPVTVASSDLYVGPNGELLQRVSADGRQLEGSEDPQPVTVTQELPVVDLSGR